MFRRGERKWAAEHRAFEAEVITRFGNQLAAIGFDANPGGLPWPVGRYAVLFEGPEESRNQHPDVEDGSELWLEFDRTIGCVEVHIAGHPGHYSAAADSMPAALDVMAVGLRKLLQL